MYLNDLIKEIGELDGIAEVATRFVTHENGETLYSLYVRGKSGRTINVPCVRNFSLKVQELSVVAIQLMLAVITGTPTVTFDNLNDLMIKASEQYPYRGEVVIDAGISNNGLPKEIIM